MAYEWKVGDIVALIRSGPPSMRVPLKRAVARVTPSGLVVLNGSLGKFNADGWKQGGNVWDKPRIEPWSAQHVAARTAYRKVRVLEALKPLLADIPRPVLRQLMAEALQDPSIIPT